MIHLKKNMPFSCSIGIAVMVLALASFSGQDVAEIKNGSVGLWKKNPKISLEFVRTIGELDSDDENLLFYKPADIVFDTEGNIYVLDAGNHRVQKFSPEGEFISSFGRKGQGPGEFQMPLSIDFDEKGRIYIPDAHNQRIGIFNSEGTLVESLSMHEHMAGPIRVFQDGRILMGTGGIRSISLGDPKGSNELPKYLKILDSAGTLQSSIGEKFNYKDMILNSVGNDYDFDVDQDGNIYSAFKYQNRIEKFDHVGNLHWQASRELGYSTKPPKERSDTKVSGNQVSVSIPRMNRCSNGIAVDENGYVWVVGLKRQVIESEPSGAPGSNERQDEEPSKTDIFQLELYDGDGMLLYKFPLTQYVDGIRCHKDRIYLLDADHTAQFFEYRIIEK
ncbi:MAG: NHL repeat-containing protein [Candidatus Aminicenantes bacterium]|nr:MAG: NHL repeat-containing protein [Candidatus Aminicenantes bacterium]